MQGQLNQDINNISNSPVSQGLTQQMSPLDNNRSLKEAPSETWRTEMLAKILIAFWLESYVSRLPETNYPNSGHITQLTTFSTLLPSNELLRCVRMFIKHAHYFANACKEGGPYVPSSLRFSPGGADLFSTHEGIGGSNLDGSSGGQAGGNKKVLYLFLELCIDHWPLDASFRLVLETWLSYIQPWRYTQISNKDIDSCEPVDLKWTGFVDENYRFYTNILGKILMKRFFRLDLSSHKNAYMLFRIAKVYSQDNLINILCHVSAMQGRSTFQNVTINTSPTRASGANFSSATNLSNIQAFKDSGHGLFGASIVHLLGPEFKEAMTKILHATLDAKQSEMRTRKIAENFNKSQTQKEKSIGFPSRVVAFIVDVLGMRTTSRPSSPGASGMDPAEKIESDKTLQYLDFCLEKLSSIFELQSVVENWNRQYENLNLCSDVTDHCKNSRITDIASEQIRSNGLSPAQRRDILLKRVKVQTKYDGNPDRIPIRTDECRLLVQILLHASNQIDKKWRPIIEDWYGRKSGFVYKVFRQVCSAPCIYRSSISESNEANSTEVVATQIHNMDTSYCGSLQQYDVGRKRRLPARIVLRPLASYKFITYLSLAYLILIFMWQKSFLSSTLHLLALYILSLVAKALVDSVSGDDKKHTENNVPKTIDLTLNATILSQDDSL